MGRMSYALEQGQALNIILLLGDVSLVPVVWYLEPSQSVISLFSSQMILWHA